jgi:uncharacterized protein YdhG (YjbR/CyaY superfamily)
MKERAAELRAEARRQKSADKAAAELQTVLDAIAAMPPEDRAIAERLHAIVTDAAPQLAPRTWYGMPAYALDGKVFCFLQSAAKFETRYSTFGFNDSAQLDDGGLWATSFALAKLGADEEKTLRALLAKALG